MQKQFLKHINKCFRSLNYSLLLVESDCSAESIHQLRLNIKKIRALLKIIDYKQNIKTDARTIKSLNNIFNYSGLLRDVQVQIHLIKLYKEQVKDEEGDLLHFKKEQKGFEKRLRTTLSKVNSFDIVLLNQRIESYFEEQSDEIIENTLQQKAETLRAEIIQFIKNGIDDNSLHRIRVLLKEYINISNLLKKGQSRNLAEVSSLISLDDLQRKIGAWHDLVLLYDRLISLNLNMYQTLEAIKSDKDLIHKELVASLQQVKL